MLERPPFSPGVGDGEQRQVQIAWPEAALRDGQDCFVGFLMPAVDPVATYGLEWILQERQARAEGLLLGLAARIALAANIATAIAGLNENGHRVVYLDPSKLRFDPRSQEAVMLDCDSFSIQGKDERFPAEHAANGRPSADYLAPEFQDRPIPPEGEESQDRFGLAVLIFQLLNFGIHPYAGIPTDDGVPTDVAGGIAQRCYVYGSNANSVLQPSRASGHLAMPPELRSLFDRAFEGVAAARPTAREWATLLNTYAMPRNKCLCTCAANAAHQHFVDLPCAACARAELIVGAANASGLDLEKEPDPIGAGVQPFGAPQSVAEPLPPALQVAVPIHMLPPGEEPPKGLSKGAVTGIRAVAALLLVAIGVKLSIAYADRLASMAPSRHGFAGEPAGPLGEPRADPDLLGFPAMEKEEALTEGYAKVAARALARGDRGTWEKAMATLRGRVPTHQASATNEHQAAFATFSASVNPESYNERQRQKLIASLHQALRDNPFDDEAAVELGWLSLLGGERDEARRYYAHAIWVNPDRANAWYGFGVVAGDKEQTSGALAVAELLTSDPALAQHMRNAYPPLLLRLCAIKPEYFAMLQSEAQRIAGQNRPVSAPPDASPPTSSSASPK
jgi:hypothetical protein